MSLLAGHSLQKAEALKTKAQQNTAMQAALSLLNLELARTTEAVRAAGLMVEAHTQLTREEFNRYMQKMVTNQLSVNLMEWQPIVPAAQLAQFEAAAQSAGQPDFRVVQPDASGKGWEPVHGRDEYVPVLFAWPQSYRTEGLDMGFSPERMASKLQSRAVGQPVASGSFEFMKEGLLKSGSMAIAISTTVFGADHTAKGYLAAVVDLPTLFAQATRVADASQFDLLVFAPDASQDAPVYAALGTASDLKSSKKSLRVATAHDPSATVGFALASWKLVLHPRPAFYARTQEYGSRLALLGGLGATLLIALALFQRQMSRQKIERAESAARNANLALEAERQRLQEAQRIAHVGSWQMDASGTQVWSDEMFRIVGLSPGSAAPLYAQASTLFTPESWARLVGALAQTTESGTPYALELEMVKADGSQGWMLGRGEAVRNAQGAIVGARGTATEITQRKRSEKSLHRLTTMMERTESMARLASFEWEVDTDALACSPEMFRIFGRDPAWAIPNLEGQAQLYTPESTQILFAAVSKAVSEGTPYEIELMTVQPSGEQRPCIAKGFPERDASGRVVRVSGLVQDITERKQAEAKLQLAASVFSHAREGVFITDAQGTILDVNAAFTQITGFSQEEAIGQSPRILSSGIHDPTFYDTLWHALQVDGAWAGEIWNRRKNGEMYPGLLTISAVRDGQNTTQQHVAILSDITERKEHDRQLEHIAHFDAMTNLPNRVLLADRLQQAMAQAQRRGQQVAVAYLDLDGFKAINDRHGHQTGDQVLITLSRRMKEALREGDTLARIGGDEFVAVLIALDDTSASVPLLNRLLETAALPVQVGELSLQVSASLGVTFYPQAHDIDADQLLRQADQAMYHAKVAGKNRYQIFDATQDSSLRAHHESLERIRLALAHGEFVLHYQPKVNMHSGQVIGAEALIRWQHPEKGLLAPAAFLPVIDDHPLSVEVGEWVINTALQQIEAWRATGLKMPVSVNIGARQLQQANFVARLQSILDQHPHVTPTHLVLEVLETSALADMEQVSQVIEACRQMGVRFALDDFGTGYSSLTYLKRLRVALLKIDQSFVRNMLDDPDDLAILQGVIGLAAAFKREVIAEGVETVGHGTALLQLGCVLAQGYGIARPMPPIDMPAWVAAWQPDAAWGAVLAPNAVSPPLKE